MRQIVMQLNIDTINSIVAIRKLNNISMKHCCFFNLAIEKNHCYAFVYKTMLLLTVKHICNEIYI